MPNIFSNNQRYKSAKKKLEKEFKVQFVEVLDSAPEMNMGDVPASSKKSFDVPSRYSLKPKYGKRVVLFPLVIVALVALVWSGLFLASKQGGINPQLKDYFIVLKYLDDKGNFASGIKIVHEDKLLGFTDSYGVWQGFLRVEEGSEPKLKFSKDNKTIVRNFNALPFEGSFKRISLRGVWNHGNTSSVAEGNLVVGTDHPEISVFLKKNGNYSRRAGEKLKYVETELSSILKKGLSSKTQRIIDQITIEDIYNQSHLMYLKVSSPVFKFIVNYSGDGEKMLQAILTGIINNAPRTAKLDLNNDTWTIDSMDELLPIQSSSQGMSENGETLEFQQMEETGGKPQYYASGFTLSPCGIDSNSCEITVFAGYKRPTNKRQLRSELKLADSEYLQRLNMENIEVYVGGQFAEKSSDDTWRFFSNPHEELFVAFIEGDVVRYRRKVAARLDSELNQPIRL